MIDKYAFLILLRSSFVQQDIRVSKGKPFRNAYSGTVDMAMAAKIS